MQGYLNEELLVVNDQLAEKINDEVSDKNIAAITANNLKKVDLSFIFSKSAREILQSCWL